ncbi:MAG TPA: hypothetical protein VJI13_03250, partial [Candidatus Norongarragalinales archaeon]|nr:hypothetical protein [Candidatus Norongarragalinales archaeon]
RMNLALGYAIVASILLLSTLSAILTFAYWANSGAMLWSASEMRTAGFIASNTPKDALFAAAGKHNHPAYTVGGRQVLAGYDGHLWSHGLLYGEQTADNRKIISEIDWGLIGKWRVSYIYAGYAEINEWGANPDAMEKSPLLEKIYEAPEIGVRIFKVRDFE